MTDAIRNIRRGRHDDAAVVARLFRHVRQTSLPFLPDLHTPAEDLLYFTKEVFPVQDVWICENDGIVAFCAFHDGWLNHLYVAPALHGRGVGSALLQKAKEAFSPLRLWVFQRNRPAISFYEKRGFQRISMTDGADNAEKEPDVLFEWVSER
jgi:putative acetyltransferase